MLSELHTGESATVLRVLGHGGFRRRIMEMGFVRGKEVKVLLNAPLKDPVKYQVMGYEVSLRRAEAAMIEVTTERDPRPAVAAGEVVEHCAGTPVENPQKTINARIAYNRTFHAKKQLDTLRGAVGPLVKLAGQIFDRQDMRVSLRECRRRPGRRGLV